MEKEIIKEEESKSIIKSDNFDERFSELEKISRKARIFYIEKNDSNERIQRSDHKTVCNC
ncbi:hypothetical protein KKA24_02855 [Patescibacteria group bacterium]|nr:hypothetical protein [Patescibacteria group bacterium]